MATTVATATSRGNPRQVAEELAGALKRGLEQQRPELVLVFASTEQPLGEVTATLRERLPDTLVLGASTAGEFTERGDTKGGASAVALAGDLRVHAGFSDGLGADPEGAVARATADLPDAEDGFPHATGLLLLDPLAGTGEEATLLAAAHLGDIPLAGGAAGDDLGMKSTQVACGERVGSDAVVVAKVFTQAPLGVGVSHGHRALSEPVEVTRAEGNVVHELDGRPAWDVWLEKTRGHASASGIDPDSLGDDVGGYLLRYEGGLASGEELKIRAPLGRAEDGSLSFACGIPQGAVLRITESEPSRQVDSARDAARKAREALGGGDAAGAIVFDCICRNLILGDRFADAVEGISQELGGVPLAGFETYGEIAMDVGDMSGFHNTTTVVLALPR